MRKTDTSFLQKLNKIHMLNRFSSQIMAEHRDFIILKINELADSCVETPKGKKGAPKTKVCLQKFMKIKGDK